VIDFFLHELETNSKYAQLSCKCCTNVILPVIPARRTSNSAVVEAKSCMENHVKVAQSSSDPSISQVNWGHLLSKYLNAGTIRE